MTAQQYQRWTEIFRQEPWALGFVRKACKYETWVFYIAYPLLLIILLATGSPLLARAVLVPAIGFVLTSLVRAGLNWSRPYEDLDIDPIIPKDTVGKSFPSRHVFSCYMIAMTWLAYNIPVGVILLLLGIDMMYVRVIGGVHYPQDVIVGALLGVVMGLIGFFI